MSLARLNLDQVASFLALVDVGGFVAAAKLLGLSQSAVSQHIKSLETVLKAPLLHRARNGCIPTEAGDRFLPLARSLLRLEARPHQAIAVRTLCVGACSNIGIYVLPEVMGKFVAAGEIAPLLSIGANPSIAARLADGEVDIALMEWWDGRPGFAAEPWREEPIVAIAAPHHPWADKTAIRRKDLASVALIGGEPGTGTGRLLRRHLGARFALPRPAMELGSTEAVKKAVMAGLGVSVALAATVMDDVHNGQLITRPLEPALSKSLQIVRRVDVPPDHPLMAFLCAKASVCKRSPGFLDS